MHEFDIINTYFAPLTSPEGLSLQDDAALLAPSERCEQVVTKDLLVAGTHFFPNDDPSKLAQKLWAVNCSDLAAMGAVPKSYFLGLALPKNTDEDWIKAFANGVKQALTLYGGALLGGDTTRHHDAKSPLVLSLTAIGEVPKGKALLRSGAKAGDELYVTGAIGDAYLGLQLLLGKLDASLLTVKESDVLKKRYHLPSARISFGQALQDIASACADISDGLVADAEHIALASDVGVDIQCEDIPLSPAAKKLCDQHVATIEQLITAGDDYELLVTVPPEKRQALHALSKQLNLPTTLIGKITKGQGVKVFQAGQPVLLQQTGYRHF